jgi:hypothetical protein
MNINDDRHTRPTVKLATVKDPFYRMVTCSKAVGGSHTLWHAKLTEETTVKCWALLGIPFTKACSLTGAGNTADNAIKDLQSQIRALKGEPKDS